MSERSSHEATSRSGVGGWVVDGGGGEGVGGGVGVELKCCSMRSINKSCGFVQLLANLLNL